MVVIPKVKLIPQADTEEGKDIIGYKWNEAAGKRHFLGGDLSNARLKVYPLCEDCGKEMTLYAQVDSIGEEFDLADCMVIHNFVCFDCFTVKARLSQVD